MQRPHADQTVGSAKPLRGRKKSHAGRTIVLAMVAALAALAAVFYFVLPAQAPLSTETQACAARLYSSYNPKNLEQCIAVCQKCGSGGKRTCATSCSLKGAR
jgi:hypothetical protein